MTSVLLKVIKSALWLEYYLVVIKSAIMSSVLLRNNKIRNFDLHII